ncbi:MAG: hypothetical protein JO040_00590, partial [Gemmatimonadetes bacterium]|nr:hypothetical protein [Gemmatimonadota bacterium]
MPPRGVLRWAPADLAAFELPPLGGEPEVPEADLVAEVDEAAVAASAEEAAEQARLEAEAA